MNDKVLDIEEREDVVLLTLNRPNKRNALNKELRTQLHVSLDKFADEKKVIIISGYGKGFCAGLDLKENPDKETLLHFWHLIEKIQLSKCIFIAAVNGIAVGGGLIIVNACDIAIGSDTSRYGMPNVNTAMFPALKDPLKKLKESETGQAWKDITGKLISGSEALDQGLLNSKSSQAHFIQDSWKLANYLCKYDKTQLIEAKDKTIEKYNPIPSQPEVSILGNRSKRDFRKFLKIK